MELLRARGTWRPPFGVTLEDGRGHRVESDFSREDGGDDRGPSSLELAVFSLTGCVGAIFALVAERRRLSYSALELDVEADRPPRSRTITAVRGTVRVTTEAPEDDVATALALTVRTCPVGVLFASAGIPVSLSPVVVRSSGATVPLAPVGHTASG